MGTVNLPNTSKTTSDVNAFSDVYSNDNAIVTQVNGQLDNSNLSASAAIAHSKLAAATAGYVLQANGSGVITATAWTGDVTVGSTGVTAIGNDKVTSAMIATDAVGSAEIAADAVGSSEIAANAVSSSELADAAATSRKVQLSYGTAAASSTLTPLTGSYQDVPGATVTFSPAVASVAFVTAVVYYAFSTASSTIDQVALTRLVVDGVAQSALAVGAVEAKFDNTGPSPNVGFTATQTWPITLTAASHTLKLQSSSSSLNGTTTVQSGYTTLSYILFSQ